MSEERIIPDAAEFASAASRSTVFWTNVFQSLLVASVVLWVLDIPRQVFNVSFYTEQLLDHLSRPDIGTRLYRRYVAAAALVRLGSSCSFDRALCLHHGPLCHAYRRSGADSVKRPDRQRSADPAHHGSKSPHQWLGFRQHDRGHGDLRLYQPASARRFPDALRLAAKDDRISRPRY